MLDRLVRRAVLADADRIMREDMTTGSSISAASRIGGRM